MTSLESICDTLAVYGVHEGYPAERRAFAALLIQAGVSEDDVEVFGDHLSVTEKRASVPKILAKALVADDLQLRLADLRRVRDLRAAKASQRFGDKGATIAPLPGEDRSAWEWDRKCVIAKCRVVGDRRSHREVADELAVDLADLPAMVARGLEMTKPIDMPHPTRKAPDRGPEKSRQCKIDELLAWAQSRGV